MKQLTRSRDDRWVSGVCGGIAAYTGVDANLIRLATVILTILGFGSVVVIYLLAWLIMPQVDTSAPPPQDGPLPPPPAS